MPRHALASFSECSPMTQYTKHTFHLHHHNHHRHHHHHYHHHHRHRLRDEVFPSHIYHSVLNPALPSSASFTGFGSNHDDIIVIDVEWYWSQNMTKSSPPSSSPSQLSSLWHWIFNPAHIWISVLIFAAWHQNTDVAKLIHHKNPLSPQFTNV